jgi:cytochrome P450
MREAADESVAKLLAAGRRGPVRVDQEVTLFAADVIFRTIFSEPVPPKTADRIIRAFERFQRLAYPHGMAKQLHIPMAVMPGALIKALAARSIRQALKAPLDRRLRAIAAGEETPTGDIAASLIAGTDPVTGKRFGQRQLLEEVSMFFLAGHETSAAALGWSLYLLATHPQVQDRVLAEVRETVGERPLEFSDIKRLVLTRNVFREAMRLYPPVAVITRDAARCEHMADRDIEPDSLIFVTPWIMHRQARFWNNPNSFDPDRFEDETVKPAIRDAYMPFSMGPRVCPGAAFALQEGALLLAMAVRAARFEPAPGHRPAPIARLTLRSANGVLLKVSPRTDRTP